MYEIIRKEYRGYLTICIVVIVILAGIVSLSDWLSGGSVSWVCMQCIKWNVLLAFAGLFIFSIYEYRSYNPKTKDSTTVKMTFKQFRDIYNINPSSWRINKYNIEYHYEEVKNVSSRYNGSYWVSPRTYTHTNEIYFNFIDWVRLVFWLRSRYRNDKRKEKSDLLRAQNESLAKMLVNVQKDINESIKKMQEDLK